VRPHVNPKKVWALFGAVFIGTCVLSELIAPGHDQYMLASRAIKPGEETKLDAKRSVLANSSFESLLPTLLGVREVLASLMWVQADDYFHRGEYRPIMRMVRQIVTIDPHQLDVYATGAWHMAYNFMDKRLIADGVQFLEEGCRNNDSVYDLYFELGYMHYDKTKNFRKAVESYRASSTRGTTAGKPEAPAYVRHQLAHAIEKSGDIDQCIEQWKVNLAKAIELERKGEKAMFVSGPNTDAARHNLYITERRRNERLAAVAERAGNRAEAERLWQANADLAVRRLDEAGQRGDVQGDLAVARQNVARLRAGTLSPSAPTDLGLTFTVTRIAPKKLKIEGTCNALNLSRVHVRFQDEDYEKRAAQGLEFKMGNCTLEYENVSVNKERFSFTLNLDRDPADMGRPPSDIYPLKADRYVLELRYNPRLQAAFIQDRYGWNGEGLVSKYLVVDEEDAGVVAGKRYPLRLVRRTVTLTRDDVVGSGQKVLFKG
jgi:tetratricopeptide (TPR) repeat protein